MDFEDNGFEFKDQILTILSRSEEIDNLGKELDEFHPYDISKAFMELEDSTRKLLFHRLPLAMVANIFEHIESEVQIEWIKALEITFAVQIIDHMETDDAVDLLQYIEDQDEDIDLVNLLSPKKRAELKKYWSYEDHEIGSVMSNSFIELSISMTVKEAMKKVTSVAGQTDYISILFVVEKHKLVGYLKLKELIIARALQTIGDIMESRLITAYATDDKEDVAQRLAEYGISSIPIIDLEHHIIGVATHDDLIDVISEAKSEDYTKFAALSSAEIDFESEGIMASIKKRLPWLSILLGLSIVTSFILSLFEGQLSSSAGAMRLAASLAIYLPLILDMSGNTGTQSLAVMIRYLSSQHEKISRKEIYRHMRRELGTGTVQGIILGIVICGIILLTQWISKGTIDSLSWMTALVTSGSICIALIVSTVMGALIPLFMDKVHIDPAVASGPFITTISDIITLTLYYSISLALLLPLYTL